MKYHLYDENYNHKGDIQNLQEMRNYLCEWKYDNNDKTYMEDTFDFIKAIKWHWDCLLYTSPSPRDVEESRMPSSA